VGPNVLVKGGDWPVERIVGRDAVEERGGRVLSIPLCRGVSTTGIIEKIRGGRG
jgi:bifunctional ADP-heptose synthase (sugar kinase/adenylyltransferase)